MDHQKTKTIFLTQWALGGDTILYKNGYRGYDHEMVRYCEEKVKGGALNTREIGTLIILSIGPQNARKLLGFLTSISVNIIYSLEIYFNCIFSYSLSYEIVIWWFYSIYFACWRQTFFLDKKKYAKKSRIHQNSQSSCKYPYLYFRLSMVVTSYIGQRFTGR